MPLAALRSLAVVVVAAGALAAPATAQTMGIESFDARIAVAADGSLTVSETIVLVAGAGELRQDLWRDVGTLHDDPVGLPALIDIEVLDARIDGEPAPWRMERQDGSVRIAIVGDGRNLEPGTHVYELAYRTGSVVGLLDGGEGFVWDVTGDKRAYPIQHARTVIAPPPGTSLLGSWIVSAPGVRERVQGGRIASDGAVIFVAPGPLARHEGLSVALAWTPGITARPSLVARLPALAAANPGLLVGVLGLAATLFYYLVVWHRVGRDPRAGTIVPLFEPPAGLSPVAAGYIWHKGFGILFDLEEAFSVALASLATKGFVAIARIDGGLRIDKLRAPTADLPPTEFATMYGLFTHGSCGIAIDQASVSATDQAMQGIAMTAPEELVVDLHLRNHGIWAGGCAIAASVCMGLLIDGGIEALGTLIVFIIVAGTFVAIGQVTLRRIWQHILHALRGRTSRFAPAVLAVVVSAVLFLPAVLMAAYAAETLPWAHVSLLLLTFAVMIVFLKLLAAPTRVGRALLDQLAGYRLYLSLAESARLEWSSREPVMTQALFEHHLPYAMALGVADTWTESFARSANVARQRVERPDQDHGIRYPQQAVMFAGGLRQAIARAHERTTGP